MTFKESIMTILLILSLLSGGALWRAWASWRRLLRQLPRRNRDMVLF